MQTMTPLTLAVCSALLGGGYDAREVLHQDGAIKVQQMKDYSGPFAHGEPRTYNSLLMGGIDRGRTYLKPADKEAQGVAGKDYSLLPTCYHHPLSPIGLVVQQFQPFHWPGMKLPAPPAAKDARPPLGVVGMYVGTMAAYAAPMQEVHFFESNPKIIDLCQPKKGEPFFTYIQDAKKRGATIKIFPGKERDTLAAKAPKNFYKVLVVEIATRERLEDILVELHTKEGMALLLDKLADGGILCYHVSNQFLNMVPVLADAAQSLGCASVVGHDAAPMPPNSSDRTHYSSEWVMIARDQNTLKRLQPPPGYQEQLKADHWHHGQPPYWHQPKATGKHLWTDNNKHYLKGLLRMSPFVKRVENQLGAAIQDVTGSWNASKVIHDSGVFLGLGKMVAQFREDDGQTIEDLQKGY